MRKSASSRTGPIGTIFDAWRNLDSQMPRVNRAFATVRNELCEIGLLAEGFYLDAIDLVVAAFPSDRFYGEVYDNGVPLWKRAVGFKEGAIYLPRNLPRQAYVPGGTLTDTIRHEFGHAWYWLDPHFFAHSWFRQTFGFDYNESLSGKCHAQCVYREYFRTVDDPELDDSSLLLHQLERDVEFARLIKSRPGPFRLRQCLCEYQHWAFASGYATTAPKEDFAETFMYFLRYRNTLDRFRPRGGLYKKLKSVERAVSVAARCKI